MAWTTLYNQELRTKFGERAMKEGLSLTPGTPRFTARRLENPEDKITLRNMGLTEVEWGHFCT